MTVLRADLVDAPGAAARLGDRAWHDALAELDLIARREISRYRGREVRIRAG